MKKNSILIVGLGVPSELTDVLLREGCDILRSETPLQAALVLLRGDAQAVLTVGDLGEEWAEFTDVALTMGKLGGCGQHGDGACDFHEGQRWQRQWQR